MNVREGRIRRSEKGGRRGLQFRANYQTAGNSWLYAQLDWQETLSSGGGWRVEA